MTTTGLDPVALARLASLPIKARVIVEGALSGLHRARYHGSSVEFAEHKEYSPGDEIRHIDWKAYAKLDRYYVKQFEQESQLTVQLVLDASGSMEFAGGGMRKLDYAALCLAALAYLVIQQSDRVGLDVFGDPAIDARIPARARNNHLRDLLAAIDGVTAGAGRGDEPAAAALERIAETLRRRRALIIVASDLFDPDDRTLAVLRRLRAQRHDVSVLHVLDPHERTFPYEGLTLFEALESDAKMLANPAAIRAQYLERMDAFLAKCRASCAEVGIDYHQVDTDAPLDRTLLDLLVKRGQLTGHAGAP
ncbi:MAG: DUF58 domain-containing protein [Deltaproteobacteria bacterium]|nr:DUF58 domain-containing protein [Deltaproteobacteria bacterium]